jgi:hypothetical protein
MSRLLQQSLTAGQLRYHLYRSRTAIKPTGQVKAGAFPKEGRDLVRSLCIQAIRENMPHR